MGSWVGTSAGALVGSLLVPGHGSKGPWCRHASWSVLAAATMGTCLSFCHLQANLVILLNTCQYCIL